MNYRIISTSAVVALGVFVGSATAQSAPAAQPAAIPHKIGLIDMAEVFKEYTRFKELTENLKKEVETTAEQMKTVAKRIQSLQEEMKDLKKGSPKRNALEKEALGLQADMQVLRQVTQVDLARKEAAIYQSVYDEVQRAVEKYAAYYKYTLVLRYSSEPIRPDDEPPVVIQKLNRLVVYRQDQNDITRPVVAYLNRQHSSGGGN